MVFQPADIDGQGFVWFVEMFSSKTSYCHSIDIWLIRWSRVIISSTGGVAVLRGQPAWCHLDLASDISNNSAGYYCIRHLDY